MGFVQGKEVRDNTIITVDIIQYAHSNQIQLMILSIDAEKAFDRIPGSLYPKLSNI